MNIIICLGLPPQPIENNFSFEYGSKNNDFLQIKGKEKEGKWFASANNSKQISRRQRKRVLGLITLKIGILISRAVRRMHAAGLAPFRFIL